MSASASVKEGDGMIRVDSKSRAVAAPACISLSCRGALLSLSSVANVNGHDTTVQLKSESWFLFVFPLTSVVVVFDYYKQA